ncbi:MAG TPA: hypothetical protein VJ765_03425 [Chitinophagaceae bacterium]|nr:hypothetical protein [Chitinophagaceae bacterium]
MLNIKSANDEKNFVLCGGNFSALVFLCTGRKFEIDQQRFN